LFYFVLHTDTAIFTAVLYTSMIVTLYFTSFYYFARVSLLFYYFTRVSSRVRSRRQLGISGASRISFVCV